MLTSIYVGIIWVNQPVLWEPMVVIIGGKSEIKKGMKYTNALLF